MQCGDGGGGGGGAVGDVGRASGRELDAGPVCTSKREISGSPGATAVKPSMLHGRTRGAIPWQASISLPPVPDVFACSGTARRSLYRHSSSVAAAARRVCTHYRPC